MYGENSESRAPDDISHWISAYTELLAFKDHLLEDMSRGMESLSKAARAEIEELDVKLIEAQRARYARRLDFWTRRQAEIRRKAGIPTCTTSTTRSTPA